MPTQATERNVRNRLILLMLGVGGAVYVSQYVEWLRLPVLMGALVFAVALAVAFTRGVEALYIVIFAMLFSPEIGSGMQTSRLSGEGGGGVVMRAEDVILLAVGVGWILRSAYLRQDFGIVRTPVNGPIGYYMAASIICTLMGVIEGSVRLDTGFFHNLKYFEYFFLFFMILAHIRRLRDLRRMIAAMLIVLALASLYGYVLMAQGVRVTAPFDAEPNTFGGYMALMLCVAGGMLLCDPRPQARMLLAGLLVLAFPPFLFTLSRSSYIALAAGLIAFMVVSRQRLLVVAMLLILILVMVIGVMAIPQTIQDRVVNTFSRGTQYHVKIAGVDLDPSASARVLSYQDAIKLWIKRPIMGYGVTGTHFIDGQYMRLLAETGVVGLSAFLVMFFSLLRGIWTSYTRARDPYLRGAALGLFCGVIAMLAHAGGANSFIIVRIAEPLWLLAGLILLIPYLEARAESEETEPTPSRVGID